jgi:hypothetical protein
MDIHSKETKHTIHEKAAYLTKFHSTSATNRIQDTKHRKTTAYTETTEHENKENATAGN